MILFTQEDMSLLLQYQNDTVNCPKCHGADNNCTCFSRYNSYFKMVASAIPIKYRDAALSNLNVSQIQQPVKKVETFIAALDTNKQMGKGLYLYGNTGTGKTYAGVCILKNALQKGYTAFFCTVEQYKAAIFNHEDDYISYIKENDFLLIDDYGREFNDSKGFIDSQIDDLLRYRSDRYKSTIITSNTQTLDLYNLRIKSILSEHYTEILFNCNDYRKTHKRSTLHEK